MKDFSINEMQEMQSLLQDKYKDKWEPICPEVGKNKLLWMLGETIIRAVIRTKDITDTAEKRQDF